MVEVDGRYVNPFQGIHRYNDDDTKIVLIDNRTRLIVKEFPYWNRPSAVKFCDEHGWVLIKDGACGNGNRLWTVERRKDEHKANIKNEPVKASEYDKGVNDGTILGRKQVLNELFTLFEEADYTMPKVMLYDSIIAYLREQDKERWDAIGETKRPWANL